MAISGGWGGIFKVAISSVLTTTPNVEKLEFPETDLETDEVTAHDSTGGAGEHIPTGRKRNAAFKLTITWDDSEATHQELRTAHTAGTVRQVSITAPDAQETFTFNAWIKKMKRVSEQAGSYRNELEILPTGQITIT